MRESKGEGTYISPNNNKPKLLIVMTRKTLRNILWAIAAIYAMAAYKNTGHLALASLIFVLGSMQTDSKKEE